MSVLQINAEHDLAIFEAGISKPGEMESLEQMIQPDIGIITNIGDAHSEGFRDNREKVLEKVKLFAGAKTIIFCSDHPLVKEVLENNTQAQLVGWRKEDLPDKLPFKDEASVENMGHCIALLKKLGYDAAATERLLQEITPVAMRLEITAGINDCLLLNDSYNSDIGSLRIALDTAKQNSQGRPVTLVISDILQDKTPDAELYQKVADVARDADVKKIIGIGKSIGAQQALFGNARFYDSTADFLKSLDTTTFNKEAIVLKGARRFNFERIARQLQNKAHETVLEINLNALKSNLDYFRQQLRPETKVMAMVKAYSYGAGSAEIAQLLSNNGVNYLGVAYADEGVALRKAGITVPIMVMSPDAGSFDTLITHNLEPEIYSLSQLDAFIRALIDHEKRDYPVHLKLETGMNRLGFTENDITALIANIKAQPEVRILSVFSHLAASDNAQEDDFTRGQIEKFNVLSKRIMASFDHPILRHILNTSGILRFPDGQFEMVRLGIGLYGVSPDTNTNLQMVSALRTRVVQIKDVPNRESVGYDRSEKMQRDSQIAILPIGYADGLSRGLSNGQGKVWIKGHLQPIVGKVCMDMCMIDVTDMDISVGDEVEIFGEHISISQLAEWMNTIPYEVLTGISQRVKRVYLSE